MIVVLQMYLNKIGINASRFLLFSPTYLSIVSAGSSGIPQKAVTGRADGNVGVINVLQMKCTTITPSFRMRVATEKLIGIYPNVTLLLIKFFKCNIT